SGAITVSANAAVRNSGLFTLEKASKFNLAGEFKNTKSGKLDDRRTGVNYDALTAFALTNEPDVEIYGIDVSRYQRDVDWEKVASSGVDFVMLRAAVGAVNGAPVAADSKFAEHFAGAREAGLEIGVYMYSYAKTVSEIKTEAKFLVKLLKDYKITYPVALDMEELRGYYTDDPSKMAEAFFTIVMDAGYYPIMYSYKSWLENLLDASVRDKYAVWVAHTGVNATTYAGNYYMWQYSHTGRISGINGDVDLNISYRDFAAFIKKNRLNNL
ncbi:MAG: glycoside hydrolase family 25 protein, partial [Oscillospiraceae bacterium]|nr:glycoside hydrolase family 25 protein [Oscillospiraceae bacterium]